MATTWDLDDSVLEEYIKGFYGHGRYDARYWFVGMEFGGGSSETEIVGRVRGWYERGRHELEDLGGSSKWFRDPVPLQPTWKQLIRIVLSAAGLPTNDQEIRAYQKLRLGRGDGLDCILELLPLPSPGLRHWLFYPEHSKLPYLKDRATYSGHVIPGRITHLRERIAEHQPAAVIFYGRGYDSWWRAIADADFKASNVSRVSIARNEHTLFVTTPHPTAHGLTNDYFEAIGHLIAEELRE